jgi:hypothetical protein
MVSVQSEDALDLELRRDLDEAFQEYLHAADARRADAQAAYLAKLHAFTARVLQR